MGIIYIILGVAVAAWSILTFFPENDSAMDAVIRALIFIMIVFMWPVWLFAIGFGALASHVANRKP